MTRTVALTDDGFTHLSRLGSHTLCGKRTRFECEHESGRSCPECERKLAEQGKQQT